MSEPPSPASPSETVLLLDQHQRLASTRLDQLRAAEELSLHRQKECDRLFADLTACSSRLEEKSQQVLELQRRVDDEDAKRQNDLLEIARLKREVLLQAKVRFDFFLFSLFLCWISYSSRIHHLFFAFWISFSPSPSSFPTIGFHVILFPRSNVPLLPSLFHIELVE